MKTVKTTQNGVVHHLQELEEDTAKEWLAKGTIWITSVGSENVYFNDEFRGEFYCKCYPQERTYYSSGLGNIYMEHLTGSLVQKGFYFIK